VADREVADAMARSFLGKLPSEVVHQLTAEGERVDYPPGTAFYREGWAPRAALVVTGLIRVYMASSEGRQVTVRYARNSDVLGIALIVGGPLNVSAQTLAPSSLFNIDSRALVEAAHEDARVALALAEELSRRLDDTLQQTAINAFGSVKQRVASHLLDLASAQQRPEARLVAQVSQQELADAVGSVREVVARTLRELRVAGIVATSHDSVLIVDAARLYEESWGSTAT
jgi:CRP/FNR family transcriptional regulator, cyclic AMP receptor protein